MADILVITISLITAVLLSYWRGYERGLKSEGNSPTYQQLYGDSQKQVADLLVINEKIQKAFDDMKKAAEKFEQAAITNYNTAQNLMEKLK